VHCEAKREERVVVESVVVAKCGDTNDYRTKKRAEEEREMM
jgi:hypothetical protein|tara:strand:- start:1124 stop:1246 length:123 start_codon:yes stop_codon:yes gene_type:complete